MSLVLEALQKQGVERQINDIFQEKTLPSARSIPSGKKGGYTKKPLQPIILLALSLSVLIIITSIGVAKVSPILRRRIITSNNIPEMSSISSKNPEFNPLNLRVKGIVWDTKEPIVLIGGKFLTTGEEYMGMKIKKVYLNKVLVEYRGKEHYLYVQ